MYTELTPEFGDVSVDCVSSFKCDVINDHSIDHIIANYLFSGHHRLLLNGYFVFCLNAINDQFRTAYINIYKVVWSVIEWSVVVLIVVVFIFSVELI